MEFVRFPLKRVKGLVTTFTCRDTRIRELISGQFLNLYFVDLARIRFQLFWHHIYRDSHNRFTAAGKHALDRANV